MANLFNSIKITFPRWVFIYVTFFIVSIIFYTPAISGTISAHWITSSDSLFTGDYANGQIGDIMMENDRIAVIISSIGHLVQAKSGGNIIDAGSKTDRIDALGELYTYFNDDWPRQTIYNSISIINDGTGGGQVLIRASGVDSDDSFLTVITEYSLTTGTNFLSVSTTITNTGSDTYIDFELGDVFHWGGCNKFAPGNGFSLSGTTSAPWLAGTSGLISYGYFSMKADTLWGPHGNDWSDINIKAANLNPGGSCTYTRNFIIGGNDIASVARIIHEIDGTPVGSFDCSVRSQSSNEPILSATIDVNDDAHTPYLQMVTDSLGIAFTTLPPGNWQISASAVGYDKAEIWLNVPLNGLVSYNFNLTPNSPVIPVGDTLTIIQRPIINIPTIVQPGDTFTIECEAEAEISNWAAKLICNQIQISLPILTSSYNPATLWWSLSVKAPNIPIYELYDLVVTANGGIEDTARNSVRIIPEFKTDYYFIHITDTHLPTHLYYYQEGAATDTSEMLDMLEVIKDINIINPEFVLLTGDLVNEGGLEDFLSKRYYTMAQQILSKFDVPLFLTSGNHDIGGWPDTPIPTGTARRNWWKFFGWKQLDTPSPSAPQFTQNYSFDYGPVHYVGLESYINYDSWRWSIYGDQSLSQGQLQWLTNDLAAAGGSSSQVLFYHYDFSNEIDLAALGVEMALWGHVHHDAGNITTRPYDLATNNVCDNERSYRLIRVSNGVVQPTPTISSGADGQKLNVTFQPANNGMNYTVTAQIVNNITEQFEQAQLRFLMPKNGINAQITGGILNQIDDADSIAIYYIDVDIQPNTIQTVMLVLEEGFTQIPNEDSLSIPDSYILQQNYPNPFNPTTILNYTIPKKGHVSLKVFDLLGNEIMTLVNEEKQIGNYKIVFDAANLASGTYLYNLHIGKYSETKKMILLR